MYTFLYGRSFGAFVIGFSFFEDDGVDGFFFEADRFGVVDVERFGVDVERVGVARVRDGLTSSSDIKKSSSWSISLSTYSLSSCMYSSAFAVFRIFLGGVSTSIVSVSGIGCTAGFVISQYFARKANNVCPLTVRYCHPLTDFPPLQYLAKAVGYLLIHEHEKNVPFDELLSGHLQTTPSRYFR
jgi:hypothetical protein